MATTPAGLFASYEPRGFCEVLDAGSVRPHYRRLVRRLDALSPSDLGDRVALTQSIFRRQGITFGVYGTEEDSTERTWPLDLIPRIIPMAEWQHIEAGLIQRVRALELFLNDVYTGEQAALHDGIVPRWLAESADGYQREVIGITVPGTGGRCTVAGIDLVRDGEGTYRVLEDNLRVPSGVSYVLENRAAMTRALAAVFENERVRPVNHYGAALLRTLRDLAPPASVGSDPTIVVLTPGVYNAAYFEHAFLARQMGIELVEGRDLVVEDQVVHMRTTRGLQRVDVIYRRVGDESLDPVVFHRGSVLGVPGLMGAVRAGTVTLANAIGNGVADDKAIYPFVPDMIHYYLDEEPILPNVRTYLPWDPEQRAFILENIGSLVVKPVADAGGYGILIGPAASDEDIAKVAAAVEDNPRGFIAQDVVQLSTHPTWTANGLRPRRIDLRPFVLSGRTIEVLPGGLTRVALREGGLIVNSSQGGGSKDTWVLIDR